MMPPATEEGAHIEREVQKAMALKQKMLTPNELYEDINSSVASTGQHAAATTAVTATAATGGGETQRAGGVNQAAELARLTGMEVLFGEAIPYSGGSYGDAVLSRLPIEAELIWKLPAEPQHEERVAVGILVRLPSGERIRFLGTHLDHTRDPSDRVRQAQSILE